MGKIPVDDNHNEVLRKAAQDSSDNTKYDLRTFVTNENGDEIPVSVVKADKTVITNLSLTANTETSHTFQSNITKAMIRVRELTDMQFSFTATESNTKYITLKGGCVLTLTDFDLTSKIMYARTSVNSTIEILEFYL